MCLLYLTVLNIRVSCAQHLLRVPYSRNIPYLYLLCCFVLFCNCPLLLVEDFTQVFLLYKELLSFLDHVNYISVVLYYGIITSYLLFIISRLFLNRKICLDFIKLGNGHCHGYPVFSVNFLFYAYLFLLRDSHSDFLAHFYFLF
jgi:hypothetical protein